MPREVTPLHALERAFGIARSRGAEHIALPNYCITMKALLFFGAMAFLALTSCATVHQQAAYRQQCRMGARRAVCFSQASGEYYSCFVCLDGDVQEPK